MIIQLVVKLMEFWNTLRNKKNPLKSIEIKIAVQKLFYKNRIQHCLRISMN